MWQLMGFECIELCIAVNDSIGNVKYTVLQYYNTVLNTVYWAENYA